MKPAVRNSARKGNRICWFKRHWEKILIYQELNNDYYGNTEVLGILTSLQIIGLACWCNQLYALPCLNYDIRT